MTSRSAGSTALALALFIVSLGVAVGAAAAPLSRGDTAFIKKAAADGIAEVQLGQLAHEKAMREEVKQFAGRIVQDHTKANEQLQALARSNNVELPTSTDQEHVKKMKELEKLSGPDFDRAYMHLMVEDHEGDVKEFKSKAKSKHPSDVTSFAAATLPTLEEHLAAARVTYDIAAAGKRSGNRETGSKKP